MTDQRPPRDGGVPAIKVAEQIRWLRDQEGEPTTPMHVLKLVYIAHGWTLGLTSQPLIAQFAEAWKYGPVIPDVYHQYKVFGGYPIIMGTRDQELPLDDYTNDILLAVENHYRDFTAPQLSALTHEEGSPWHTTIKKHGHVNALIPNNVIRDYYKSKIDK